MRKLVSAIRLPAIAFGILLIPFSIYFIHVRSQKEYLQNRNFRLLATMSDQIRAKVNGFESVIGNAVNGPRFDYKEYLKDQQLKCLPQGCEETPVGSSSVPSSLSISVEH